jgi:cytochrome c oxidase assembly protein subunit 15
LRVRLDERLFAKIHGCFGPAFFALAVALAVFTSPLWLVKAGPRIDRAAGKLQRLAWLTTLFAYVQIVLGAQLRHVSLDLPAMRFRIFVLLHIFVALALSAHVLLIAVRVLRHYRSEAALARPAIGLAALLATQLALGGGTWVLNYGWPTWFGGFAFSQEFLVLEKGQLQALVTTAHVALGSLIFVTSLMLSLRSVRLLQSGSSAAAVWPRAVGMAA